MWSWGSVAESCEHDDKLTDMVQDGKFLYHLTDDHWYCAATTEGSPTDRRCNCTSTRTLYFPLAYVNQLKARMYIENYQDRHQENVLTPGGVEKYFGGGSGTARKSEGVVAWEFLCTLGTPPTITKCTVDTRNWYILEMYSVLEVALYLLTVKYLAAEGTSQVSWNRFWKNENRRGEHNITAFEWSCNVFSIHCP